MLKKDKRLLIIKAQQLGFQVVDELSTKAEYRNALAFLVENVNILKEEKTDANRIVQHGIDNIYIDYDLPERGKEWHQGNIAHFEKWGYIHIAVDDDLMLYVVCQNSEDLF